MAKLMIAFACTILYNSGLAQFKPYRQLLIFYSENNQQQVVKQRQLFETGEAGIKERDIRVSYCSAETGESCRKDAGISIQADSFAVVLIGKDGGIKKQWKQPVTLKELFSVIDSMPMRKEEMRRNG